MLYGPLDGITNNATGTIRILGDGNLLAEYTTAYGLPPNPFSVDVTNVKILQIHMPSASNECRVIADAILLK